VLQFTFLALWITFGLLAGGEWTGSGLVRMAGGYMGLLTAALAFYLSAADVINEVHGRVVLPVGVPRILSGHAVAL
jgi:succinate-acetate transporter protein